jgi:superfamily II helicase
VKTNTYNKVVLDICADCWYRHFGREAKLTSMQRIQFARQGICPNCCVEKLGGAAVFIEDNMKGTKQEQRHYLPCENCGMGFGSTRFGETIGLNVSVD